MIEHLYEDLSVHLYEGEPITKKAPTPPPIIYLTQWKMMGNSTVHTDEYLTQWKVSGNSVVDNNAILSCGDLGQDGYYHVKISNGVTIYDIPLTEPLRKVGDVADTIEFADGVATVTRNIGSVDLGDYEYSKSQTNVSGVYRYTATTDLINLKNVPSSQIANALCSKYQVISANNTYTANEGVSINSVQIPRVSIYLEDYKDGNYKDTIKNILQGVEFIYELATPTTEVIQVSPFPISPTDTYTSANDTPYSAFEYKKNVEIWSCGEYSEVDGKYHIIVQPLGGSIADIALDEPLRKVNDVADTIEFVNGVATLTRNLAYYADLSQCTWVYSSSTRRMYFTPAFNIKLISTLANMLCPIYDTITQVQTIQGVDGISTQSGSPGFVVVYDSNYNTAESKNDFVNHMQGVWLLYELDTPTTETIQVPQIQEADSYSCVISQGGKAVSWSSFETNSE